MALEYNSANAADVGENKFLLGIDETDPQNPVPFKHAGVANLNQLITDAQTAATNALSRANHTGTQAQSTIDGLESDLSTLNSAVQAINVLLGDVEGDANSAVDTLREALVILQNFAEGVDVAQLITDAQNAAAAAAPLASPAFTGEPTAPTQPESDDTTKIANTAFVKRAIDGIGLASGSEVTSVDATTIETELYLRDKLSNAVVSTNVEEVLYKHEDVGAIQIGNSTFTSNKVLVNWHPTKNLGFAKSGLLTEVRVYPLQEEVVGATIQAWIVRPVNLATGEFDYVATIGEVSADALNRWHIFKGLSIPVLTGDMIAFRPKGVNLQFRTASAETAGYGQMLTTIGGGSLELSDLNDGIPSGTVVTGNRAWLFEAIVRKNPVGDNVPFGLMRLNDQKEIPGDIFRAGDNAWKQKKILWLGTSIPAGGAPSYPVRAGEYLDAVLDNQSSGSSGVIWNELRDKSLSATSAEIEALFPGWGNESYEVKMIGKDADLVVFDHGHNDRTHIAAGNLGTLDSMDRTTFYGAMNYLLDALYTDNPDVKIMFVTPPNRYTAGGFQHEQDKMDAVRDAIFALADKYGAPCCDLMKLCSINEFNVTTHMSDGTHPDQPLREKISTMLYKFIQGI